MLGFIVIWLWKLTLLLTTLPPYEYFTSIFFLHTFLVTSLRPYNKSSVVEIVMRHEYLSLHLRWVVKRVNQIRIHTRTVLKQRHSEILRLTLGWHLYHTEDLIITHHLHIHGLHTTLLLLLLFTLHL